MKPRRFGNRLFHDVPTWVNPGNLFHLRIRAEQAQETPLTEPTLAAALLDSARLYHERGRWWLMILVLMPDHLHALAAFPRDENMSTVVGAWKRWQARHHGVIWQEGYFDHRLREDESGRQLQNQADYILNNPMRAGLCERPEDWPWKIERSAGEMSL